MIFVWHKSWTFFLVQNQSPNPSGDAAGSIDSESGDDIDNGIPEQHDRDLEGEISEEFLHSQPSPEPSHHSHTDSPQLPEPERPRDQPSQGPEQPVPWDLLFPRRSTFRDAIVSNALPPLLDLLRDPSNRLKSPRDLVNEALDKCKSNGRVFWGANDVYSRKRSAVDAILAHYFSVLQDYAAGRPVAPL